MAGDAEKNTDAHGGEANIHVKDSLGKSWFAPFVVGKECGV